MIPTGLLKELARRNVMVEICLTSNETISGHQEGHHPLTTTLSTAACRWALATDDEGVARSEIFA